MILGESDQAADDRDKLWGTDIGQRRAGASHRRIGIPGSEEPGAQRTVERMPIHLTRMGDCHNGGSSVTFASQ